MCSSLNAFPFYLALGFVPIGGEAVHNEGDGVMLPCRYLEKQLTLSDNEQEDRLALIMPSNKINMVSPLLH